MLYRELIVNNFQKNTVYIRLDAISQIDQNMAPDADFTFLYLKSKKYVLQDTHTHPKPLPKLEKPVF